MMGLMASVQKSGIPNFLGKSLQNTGSGPSLTRRQVFLSSFPMEPLGELVTCRTQAWTAYFGTGYRPDRTAGVTARQEGHEACHGI